MIEYIAKRSLVPGHVAGRTYTLNVEISEAVPSVVDVRDDARSAAGATESTYERQDVYWTIDIAPFSGDKVELVREFLDSIESGEVFRVWLTDRDTVPLVLKQEGDAGAEESFMRTGYADRDTFTARFIALQAGPYDISGLQPAAFGGFEGGDAEPLDPYDPEGGDPLGNLDGGWELRNEVLHPWVAGVDPRHPLNEHVYIVERTGLNSVNGDPTGPTSIATEVDSLEDALDAVHAINPRNHSILLGYSTHLLGDGTSTIRGRLNTSTSQATGPSVAGTTQANLLLTFSAHEVVDILYYVSGSGYWAFLNSLGGVSDQALRAIGNAATEPAGASNSYAYMNIMKWATSNPGFPFNVGFASTSGGAYYGYKCVSIRTKIRPGKPSADSELVSGTFKVLQKFNESPQRKPLGPCIEDSDERYNDQAFWEEAHAAAVAAGDMAAGTYGVDYPVTQSWAYLTPIGTP